MDPAVVSRAVQPGDGGAPRRAEPGPAPGRHPRHRSAARRRRRRDRQDPGHHAPDRLAHRDASREAVGDPGPDLHRQGGRGDGRPGRPARAVRLHGHRDLDVPRVRRRADPRVRARARAADRPARPVATGGRHLPARAPVRVRPRRLPPARRSDPLPGRPGHPVQPVQGRGHRAGRLPRPRRPGRSRSPGAGRGRGGRARTRTDARARRPPTARSRRPVVRPSWPVPTRPTSACWRPTAASTSATRSRSRCGSSGPRRRPATRSPVGSATSWSTSSRTPTGPRPSWSPRSRRATAT